ncbi:MAG TPA: archaetidylserine decarboxylase [Gammaproteobacteria bacterium]|nr:archaetidylserine decarboxylase [Gammaproteobacteria bacterium]
MSGIAVRLAGWIQYPLPQHLISRLVHRAARARARWWKNALIRAFVRGYAVELAEAAVPDPSAYESFNDFFTRALKPGARPLPADPDALISPADGELARFGSVVDGTLMQAKRHWFRLDELLGGDPALAARFAGGPFATLYLAPRDYHRVHAPLSGRLCEMILVPGRLFSVNDTTARVVPRLFCRNERVVTVFETDAGPLAVVLVGALCVGSIETVWAGEVTPGSGRALRRWVYPASGTGAVQLERGAELGRFNMGSTVIVLLAQGRAAWRADLREGAVMHVNQALGRVLRPSA